MFNFFAKVSKFRLIQLIQISLLFLFVGLLGGQRKLFEALAISSSFAQETTFDDSIIKRAQRNLQDSSMKERSLSLTIWGAKLNAKASTGRSWDLRSLPDGLVRIYLAGRLLRQSGVQRDSLQPFWSLTVGPLAETRFFAGPVMVQVVDQDVLGEEVIEEITLTLPTEETLGVIQQTQGVEIDTLVYQWVELRPQVIVPNSLQVQPLNKEPNPFKLPVQPLDSDRHQELIEQRRVQSAKKSASAAQLYRAYLRAQFEGDRIQERALLLKLVRDYPNTRHGRKARRIILLDGR